MKLAFLVLRTIGSLPYPVVYRLGEILGHVYYFAARSRVRIARTNIDLCFPHLTPNERRALLKKNIISTGVGTLETAMLWFGRERDWEKYIEFEGYEHYENAMARGKGAIIMNFHFTNLEIGGCLLGSRIPMAAMYRENEYPLIEEVMKKSRDRFGHPIPRDAIRTLVRWLKGNGCVWYNADQDFGRHQSVFVPFFNIPAATITATSRYVQLTGAKVIPFTQKRIGKGKKVRLTLHPPLPISGENPEEEARVINRFLETYLRQHPEDYLWVHKRFKTRPHEDDPSFYPQNKKWRRVTPKVYQYLRNSAEWIEEKDGKPYKIKNHQGLIYFVYRDNTWLSRFNPPWRRFIHHTNREVFAGIEYRFQGLVRHCEFLNCDLVYLQQA